MGTGPFERHIREAIELNRRRAPLYAQASGGMSLPVSRGLIRRERLLLPFARWIDRRAESYTAAGIPVIDDLFVSMTGAAPFLPVVRVDEPSIAPPEGRTLTRALRRAFRQGGFDEASRVLEPELVRLAEAPAYWCMTRHMLESARRICYAAPVHLAQSRAADLPSPLWIHRLLLRLHIAALSSALRLDARAYPLQLRGIPIVCRDLPSIPPEP